MKTKKATKQAVMIRCSATGVFFGYLQARRGDEEDLTGSRHVWSWTSNELIWPSLVRGPAATYRRPSTRRCLAYSRS